MNKSESIDLLATALAKAQSEMKAAQKDAQNPFFKSNYATLDSVFEAIRIPFSKNGLCVTQPTRESDKGTIVETVIMHSSGQWISGELMINPVKLDPQSKGSALTYARRYLLSSIAGVPQSDDDGSEATGKQMVSTTGKTASKSEHWPVTAKPTPGYKKGVAADLPNFDKFNPKGEKQT